VARPARCSGILGLGECPPAPWSGPSVSTLLAGLAGAGPAPQHLAEPVGAGPRRLILRAHGSAPMGLGLAGLATGGGPYRDQGKDGRRARVRGRRTVAGHWCAPRRRRSSTSDAAGATRCFFVPARCARLAAGRGNRCLARRVQALELCADRNDRGPTGDQQQHERRQPGREFGGEGTPRSWPGRPALNHFSALSMTAVSAACTLPLVRDLEQDAGEGDGRQSADRILGGGSCRRPRRRPASARSGR
jgi:hypothetical protein